MNQFLIIRMPGTDHAIRVEGPSRGDNLSAKAIKIRGSSGESPDNYYSGWIVLSRTELEQLQSDIAEALRSDAT